MTQEEKARAYDEALERAREIKSKILSSHLSTESRKTVSEYIDTIIPQLRESEDERIRKGLIEALKASKTVGELKFVLPYPTREECIAYLEKQKELFESGRGLYYYDGEKTIYCGYPATEENPYDFAMSQQEKQKPVDNKKVEMTDFEQSVYDLCPVLGIEEAKATASDLLELAKKTLLKTGKVVLASNYPEGCSFEDGFHLGYNEGFNAKQKEQIQEVEDDLDKEIHRFFDECIDVHEAKLYGSFNERVIPVDCYELIARHFAEWGKKQKEQKPERINVKEMVAKYGATDEYIEGEYKGKPINCMIRAYEQGIRDTLLKVKEQKPAEVDESTKRLNDNWMKQHFDDYKEQKPAEWSEEDKQCLDETIEILENLGYDGDADNLKRLRPQPKQKWSEEDEKMLNNLKWAVHTKAISPLDEMDDREQYKEYEKFLESLPERFNLQPKEEWSEEDEEMLNNIEYILHKDISYTPPTKPNSCTGSGNAYYTHQTEIDWLKSLRPQYN